MTRDQEYCFLAALLALNAFSPDLPLLDRQQAKEELRTVLSTHYAPAVACGSLNLPTIPAAWNRRDAFRFFDCCMYHAHNTPVFAAPASLCAQVRGEKV